MRLIIKEYIAQLKEKDELDLLLCDLLTQNGYIADNVPKTGNRQYGVDIQLHNRTELLLLVIKQGNIDRQMWDGNINSVRQSIEEIKDVYFTMLTEPEKAKKIRIIVATNGVKEESIRANWSGYVNSNKVWNGKEIHIDFWGIDDIVDMIQKDFLNEYLFDKEQQSLLRKALYFVEESDYKRKYFENVIDGLCQKMYDASNDKEYKKSVTSLFLASQMMCQYAVNNDVVTIAIMISEYLLIKYWKYLLQKEYLGKKKYIEWLIKFCQCYDKWNGMYYAKMKKICADKTLFPNYNIVENRVMLYEILGYLTTYANFLVPYDRERAGDILTSIVLLINNNPQFVYAPYDCHVGIMVAVYRLLAKFERFEEINILLERQTMELKLHYQFNHKYPASSDSFEEAVNIEMGNTSNPYETSVFWGTMLECIACMKYDELYEALQEFLGKTLEQVTKCVWFLRKDEEESLYDYHAMYLTGEGLALEVENNFATLEKKMHFVFEQHKDEIMSFDEYDFEALEFIICRYFTYIPRVSSKFLGSDEKNDACILLAKSPKTT